MKSSPRPALATCFVISAARIVPTGAIDGLKKAQQLSPRNPLAPYLLGEIYLTTDNLGEAEAALLKAQELADSKNPAPRSHVLFVVATLYERQKKWEEAKTAWQAYAEHASTFADAGAFPQSAVERLKVVEKMLELEKAYAGVRARIAADREGRRRGQEAARQEVTPRGVGHRSGGAPGGANGQARLLKVVVRS